MADGNSQAPIPEGNTDANRPIIASIGSIDGFGPVVTTSDVTAGMGNLKMVSLTGSDGSNVMAEHHQLGNIPVVMPTQDVPPGETAARP